ncbi:hypothetical protein P154DRAFT_528025 [Amniculicola lignicola CBS 123094]|uniref:Uncharacterized protein n=1 Tax=Amniculicola lignicola CBS 123094 TaxID=1392246 RepID=A0A6A5VVU6_9PLEO|nr:hypothetical protein P154DRAFT_528025 [Amniculicola lignicola CBS 123094]
MAPRDERFRTWLRIAHFSSCGALYLKLLLYLGLLAWPRCGFLRRLVLRSLGCSRNLIVSPATRRLAFKQPSPV